MPFRIGATRRMALVGSAASGFVGWASHAQSLQSLLGDRVAAVQKRAAALGLARVGLAAPPVSGDLAAVRLNLSQLVQDGVVKAQGGDVDAAGFADDAGKLLSDVNSLSRDPDVTPELAGAAPSFGSLQGEYAQRFKAAAVDPGRRAELTAAAQRILSREARRRYAAVEAATGVPWHVIGALHYREASLNFMGHLHNGDFLKARTVQVPRGEPRPPEVWPIDPWDAEKAWQISAENALSRFHIARDGWTVERMLYAFEGYNGWGYRSHGRDAQGQPFVTPYLWNYTQFYKGGGFPADHTWSATYRSKQAGLISITKRLMELAPDEVKPAFEA